MNNRLRVLLGLAGCAVFTLKADTLLLEIGSDWDSASAEVRKTFEAKDFRGALPADMTFGVWDEKEKPDSATTAENAKWNALRRKTVRTPALFAMDAANRCYLRLENIGVKMTGAELAAKVKEAAEAYAKATKLFSQAAAAEGVAAAELYGEGFAALDPFVSGQSRTGILPESETSRGKGAFAAEWAALKAADPTDATGWQARYTLKDGFDLIAKADELIRNRKVKEVQEFINGLKARNKKHWTLVQQQAALMAEYAFYRFTANQGERKAKILEAVAKANPNTVWGACARGYLKIERHEATEAQLKAPAPAGAELKARATVEGTFKLPVKQAERDLAKVVESVKALDDESVRLSVLRLAAADAVGAEAMAEISARADGDKFLQAFFGDAAWLEDFLCSGAVNDFAKAFKDLDTLVYEAGEKALKKGLARRIATALALNGDKRTAAQLVATFNAYRALANEKRLHVRAYKQGVFDWRRVVGAGYDANDLKFANKLMNLPRGKWGTAHDPIEYRMHNCFGEFVHQPEKYYGPWFLCGWSERVATYMLGGVCGAQGHLGELINSSHGIPVLACHEPDHCCYTVMREDGTWRLCNSLRPYTDPYSPFANFSGLTPLDVLTRLYVLEREQTVESELLRLAARAAADRKLSAKSLKSLFKAATDRQPLNVQAWRFRLGYLANREGATTKELGEWATEAAAALADTRNVYWATLTPYLMHISTKSKALAAEEMARLHGLYRTDRVKVTEEMDYATLLKSQTELLKSEPKEMLKVFAAALSARGGDKSYLTDILTAGEEYLAANRPARAAYREAVKAAWDKASAAGKTAGLDFSPMILGASKAGDFASFRLAVDLQDLAQPPVMKAKGFPKELKGSRLLSDKAMLQVTSQHALNDKPARYQRALDATPWVPSKPAFCTMFATSPYAIVTLEKPADLTYVQIDARLGAKDLASAFPLELLTSTDGRTWTRLAMFTEPKQTVSVAKFDAPVRARYLKVVRHTNGTSRLFQLHKILIYGNDVEEAK